MASESDDSEGQAEASHAPRECMACRGSGRVVSNLGGAPSTVTCPWCGGEGMRLPEGDAQAHWLGDQPSADAAGEQGEAAGSAAPETAA